jgi:hypothetical protein
MEKKILISSFSSFLFAKSPEKEFVVHSFSSSLFLYVLEFKHLLQFYVVCFSFIQAHHVFDKMLL